MPNIKDRIAYYAEILTHRKTIYSPVLERITSGNEAGMSPVKFDMDQTRFEFVEMNGRGDRSEMWMKIRPVRAKESAYSLTIFAEGHSKTISRKHRHTRTQLEITYRGDDAQMILDLVKEVMAGATQAIVANDFHPMIEQPFRRKILKAETEDSSSLPMPT